MKNYHYILLGILVTAVILLFNVSLADWRVSDINTALETVDKNNDNTRALGMIGKFELIKSRIQEGREAETDFTLEARLQTLANYEGGNEDAQKIAADQNNFGFEVVKNIVNGLRAVLGKAELGSLPKTDPLFGRLQRAYLWERGRRYSEAVKFYLEVLAEKTLMRDVRSTVVLHLGFSYAMLNDFPSARDRLGTLVREDGGSEQGHLAKLLLSYLDFIESSRQKTENQDRDWLERGKRAFLNMDYAQAVQNFQSYQTDSKDARYQESLYYLGRSYEESGQIPKAVSAYRQTVYLKPEAEWSEKAALRLYMLGEFYLRNPVLVRESNEALDSQGKADQLDKLAPLAILARAQNGSETTGESANTDNSSPSLPALAASAVPEAEHLLLVEADRPQTRIYADNEFIGLAPVFVTLNKKPSLTIEGVGATGRVKTEVAASAAPGLQKVRLRLPAPVLQQVASLPLKPANPVTNEPRPPVVNPVEPPKVELPSNTLVLVAKSPARTAQKVTPWRSLPEKPGLLDFAVSGRLAPRLTLPGSLAFQLPNFYGAVKPVKFPEPVPTLRLSARRQSVVPQLINFAPDLPAFPENLRLLSRKLVRLEGLLEKGTWITDAEKAEAEILRSDFAFWTQVVPSASNRSVRAFSKISERQKEEQNLRMQLRTLERELQDIQAAGGVPKPDLRTPGTIFTSVGAAFLAAMGTSMVIQGLSSAELATATDPQRISDLRSFLPALGVINITTGIIGGVGAASGLTLWFLDGKIDGDQTPVKERAERIKSMKDELAIRAPAATPPSETQ